MERVIVIAVFICMMMTALLIAHAVVFTVLGEKCVWLIKSYRDLPKEKQNLYDPGLVVNGARNGLVLWALWFVLGAVLSYVLTPFLVVVFLGVWRLSFPAEALRKKSTKNIKGLDRALLSI